jgi:hypothetical protein
VGYGPGGRFVGRIGHIYVIRRRIGHIYMIRDVGRGVEGETETEGEGKGGLCGRERPG